jgi:hypothetical protein
MLEYLYSCSISIGNGKGSREYFWPITTNNPFIGPFFLSNGHPNSHPEHYSYKIPNPKCHT